MNYIDIGNMTIRVSVANGSRSMSITNPTSGFITYGTSAGSSSTSYLSLSSSYYDNFIGYSPNKSTSAIYVYPLFSIMVYGITNTTWNLIVSGPFIVGGVPTYQRMVFTDLSTSTGSVTVRPWMTDIMYLTSPSIGNGVTGLSDELIARNVNTSVSVNASPVTISATQSNATLYMDGSTTIPSKLVAGSSHTINAIGKPDPEITINYMNTQEPVIAT